MYLQQSKTPFFFQDSDNIDKVHLLSETIDSFNKAAFKFEKYYHHLEQRVKDLNIELKNANEALKKNLKEKEDVKNYLYNILESLTTGIIVVSPKGEITTFNQTAKNITGLNPKKTRGKKFDTIFDKNFFLNSQIDFKTLKQIQQNTEIETEIRLKDKSIIKVALSISPVKDFLGDKVGIILSIRDVSRMKQLEQQAKRTNRLSAMGEIAVKIAHDIRNPLGSIELFATTLKNDLNDFKELKALAVHISSGVKSINNTISNMLQFIRLDKKPELKIINLQDSLNDSLFFSSHLLMPDNGIEVITEYSSETLMINGDPELLKQMYLNLILNAIQAIPKNGKLIISTKRVNNRQKNLSFAEIRITDTGIGISKEDMQKIFDPFFTTKSNGTGLGLAIILNVVKIHEGTIDINSSKKGTECTITLPLIDENDQKILKRSE